MDVLSLFSGSDNVYKYLFLGGLGMVILSLFYPLEKKHELQLQKNNYNKEIRLLSVDIAQLNSKVEVLQKSSSNYQETVKGLKRIKSKKAKKLQVNIARNFTERLSSIEAERKEIAIKEINVKYNEDLIATLENHISSYNVYTGIFFWSGLVFGMTGIIGWGYLTHRKKE